MSEGPEAIWERFDREVDDDLLSAVAGAFAFVACADAHLADDEVERFLGWVREEPAFAALKDRDLEPVFRDLARAFAADFDEGARRATEAVGAVKGSEEGRALVLRAAQIAVVADEKLKAVEETALARLCEALGVDPSDW
ncbi:MAG TPA: TerB family tellurite resistance protein [Sandaracinaceae bacterium LLY-WYZ-13_1]|nr:TerB family tellurite resistance protein [Sandaracinaceae bacterium LLY-WYZ-13_1]